MTANDGQDRFFHKSPISRAREDFMEMTLYPSSRVMRPRRGGPSPPLAAALKAPLGPRMRAGFSKQGAIYAS